MWFANVIGPSSTLHLWSLWSFDIFAILSSIYIRHMTQFPFSEFRGQNSAEDQCLNSCELLVIATKEHFTRRVWMRKGLKCSYFQSSLHEEREAEDCNQRDNLKHIVFGKRFLFRSAQKCWASSYANFQTIWLALSFSTVWDILLSNNNQICSYFAFYFCQKIRKI